MTRYALLVAAVVLCHGAARAQNICNPVRVGTHIDNVSTFDGFVCCDLDGGDDPLTPSRVVAFVRLPGAAAMDAATLCNYAAAAQFPPGYEVGLIAKDGGQRGIPGGILGPAVFTPNDNQTIEYVCQPKAETLRPAEVVSILYDCPCGIERAPSGSTTCSLRQPAGSGPPTAPLAPLAEPEMVRPLPAEAPLPSDGLQAPLQAPTR